jgi:hypothetical protein
MICLLKCRPGIFNRMSHANEPGLLYWSLVEPVWLPLNYAWDQGAEEFIRQFRAAPIKARNLYAAHWCQSEVCNGGLFQFFHNSTGILAPEAERGFDAIGLGEWSAILNDAMGFFGPSYPRERKARLALLPEWVIGKRQEWDPFLKLDQRFYEWLDAEDSRWELAADRYAAEA